MNQRFIYPHKLIAHRGGGTLAPENTLAAIRDGHARGYRAVEFDVMLAKEIGRASCRERVCLPV